MGEYYDDEQEIIEAYCMSCRDTVEVEEPMAVWTRKGMPATRGVCSVCGGTVFRMGKTEAHSHMERPEPIDLGTGGDKRTTPKLEADTVYVLYAAGDDEIAETLAEDLQKIGLPSWLHEADDNTRWAGGVHPALNSCKRMVLVLSQKALDAEDVSAAWGFFREKRKPVVIAQVENVPPPDPIRRSPRFDLGNEDYKTAFRQMVQALSR